jgi:hypothetical protein
MTSLSARAMAAMFALPGLVGLLVARDGRWSSASIIFQAQAIAIILILIASLRAADEIQWGKVGAWTFLAGMLLVLALLVWAFLQTHQRDE